MPLTDPLLERLPTALAEAVRRAAAAVPDEKTAARALACLDLTSLNDDDTPARIDAVIDKAVGGPAPVAAVCLYPAFVPQAAQRLSGTPVKVATVANFPGGLPNAQAVAAAAAEAVGCGADEVDVVLPWRAFLAGERDAAAGVLTATRAATRGRVLKVILETSQFDDPAAIAAAADLAVACGADFLKTSTGKVPGGATLSSVALLWQAALAADRPVGVKASGGVKTLADAACFLALTADLAGPAAVSPDRFRFGASGLYDALTGADAPAPTAGY